MIVNIVSIDPGLDILGYCSITVDTETEMARLNKIAGIETDASFSIEARVRFILRRLNDILNSFHEKSDGISVIVIELPNDCLYGRVAGRLNGVIKLFCAVYGIVGLCVGRGVPLFTVTPHDWQKSMLPKLDEKGQVNRLSLAAANDKLVKSFGMKKLMAKEHDIAAAFNIGIYAVKKFTAKEWLL